MSSTNTRRRSRKAAPAAPVPGAAPRRAAPAAPALFDQTAAETPAETPPAPAETPEPAAETPAAAPSRVERAAEAAALADVKGDAAFRDRKRELALAALDDKAALAAAQRARDAELAAAVTEADVAEIRDNAAARKWQERGKRWRKRAVTSSLRIRRLTVNLGITGAAVYGQWEYLAEKTELGNEGSLAVSVLVELLAVSVLDYAHRRRQARRASWHLYAVAASMAGAVGGMNFAHWTESDLALVGALFFLFSIAGPMLWSLSVLESESATGEQPAARRSARFPAEQWALFLPTTFRAKRLAVRHGITDAGAALDLLAERTRERAEARAARRGKPVEQPAEQPAGGEQTLDPPAGGEQTLDPPAGGEQPAPPYQLEGVPAPDKCAEMKTAAPLELQAAARATARKAIKAGHRPTGLTLGTAYGMSDRWGRERLAEVDKITTAA